MDKVLNGIAREGGMAVVEGEGLEASGGWVNVIRVALRCIRPTLPVSVPLWFRR